VWRRSVNALLGRSDMVSTAEFLRYEFKLNFEGIGATSCI